MRSILPSQIAMRILFVKTSSLGDVLHHCPAVSDVRRRLPDAIIDWVVEEPFLEVASLHPAVRRVIPVGIRRWRKRLASPSVWAEMLAFRGALRAEAYDCVIDTQGLLKSALIAWQAQGRTHGFDVASARESVACRFYDVRHHVAREMHAVERNRALTASALGMEPIKTCDYGLHARPGKPVSGLEGYCVLFSMTSRTDKLWPEAHWSGLVKALASRGWQSVLPWGSVAEQARCRRIVEMAGSGVVPRALTLGELSSLVAGSASVVGLDTGLTHLAAALGVPVVGLYCGSDPRLTGLYGRGKLKNLGGPGEVPAVDEVSEAIRAFD